MESIKDYEYEKIVDDKYKAIIDPIINKIATQQDITQYLRDRVNDGRQLRWQVNYLKERGRNERIFINEGETLNFKTYTKGELPIMDSMSFADFRRMVDKEASFLKYPTVKRKAATLISFNRELSNEINDVKFKVERLIEVGDSIPLIKQGSKQMQITLIDLYHLSVEINKLFEFVKPNLPKLKK